MDEAIALDFEQLWELHADELTRFATLLVGPDDAPDAVAEAFIRFERFAPQVASSPRSYLFRTVRNTSIDFVRSSRRRRQYEERRPPREDDPQAMPEPDARVMRAVAGLSVQQRSVVYFAYWEDRSEQQIAEILGVSAGTVRRHLGRARDRLRKELS